MSPVTSYIYASNSLIIHKENTKEINVQWVFGNQSLISPSKIILFEKWYQAFPGVQFNSLPMDDLTAALYYLNAWNRLQMKLTSKFVKILRWARVVFSTLFSVFHLMNTDLHDKKYNKWTFSQGFTFTHVPNFGDNDNRAKLRVINPSLASTSL